jgi:MOSC domain-containing protein YiiM
MGAIELRSVNVGMPQTVIIGEQTIQTGIYKYPSEKALFLSHTQLEGDGQADLRFHGGPDKAVCAYSAEHYEYWRSQGIELSFGAFGENLTLEGLSEKETCIGDTFQLGEAVIQVCQPRMPCYKVSAKLGLPELPAQMVALGYSGYYLRVLQEGIVPPDRRFNRLERHPAGVTVDEANRVVHHDKQDYETIQLLLELDVLAESWKNILRKR